MRLFHKPGLGSERALFMAEQFAFQNVIFPDKTVDHAEGKFFIYVK